MTLFFCPRDETEFASEEEKPLCPVCKHIAKKVIFNE